MHYVQAGELHAQMRPRFHKLNNAISRLLDDYSMVSFHPLDISDEHSLAYVLYTVDSAVQYGEDADVRTSRDVDLDGGESDAYGGMGDFGDTGLDGLSLEHTGMEDPD